MTSGLPAIAVEEDGINGRRDERKEGSQQSVRHQEVEESLCGSCVNFHFKECPPGCEKKQAIEKSNRAEESSESGVVSGSASGWVISPVGGAP